MSNAFNELFKVDVSGRVEKKGGLSYLSWAWAWSEFKKRYPDSFYTIYEAENGNLYHTDGRTCWVKTGVTLVDGDYQLEHIEYLPVMDQRNNSIELDKVTSFAVNKTIQRSLTKACARHGLGLYIYAGEDLPEDADAPEQPAAPPARICAKCKGIITGIKTTKAEKSGIEVADYTKSQTGEAMCWACYNARDAEDKR